MAHAEAGRYARALQRFEEVYAETRRAAVLVNIATMQARLGRLLAAAETYRRFLATEPAPELRARVAEALAIVEGRMGRLRVEVAPPPANVASLSVEIDGRVVAPDASGAVGVDPGPHAVRVRDGERVIARGQVTVGEGESRDVRLPALALAAPSAPGEEPGEGFDWGLAGAVIGIVAAALLGVGVAVGVYAWDASRPIGGNGGVIEL